MEVVLSVLGVLYVFRYVNLYTLVVISVMQSVSKQGCGQCNAICFQSRFSLITINQKKMSGTFISWVNNILYFTSSGSLRTLPIEGDHQTASVCSSSYLKASPIDEIGFWCLIGQPAGGLSTSGTAGNYP